MLDVPRLLVVLLLSELVQLYVRSFLKCSPDSEVGVCLVGFEFVVCSECAPTCLALEMWGCVKEDWRLAKNPVVGIDLVQVSF
mgnify:CR=1 FL=1